MAKLRDLNLIDLINPKAEGTPAAEIHATPAVEEAKPIFEVVIPLTNHATNCIRKPKGVVSLN